jgi:hypothetical protein
MYRRISSVQAAILLVHSLNLSVIVTLENSILAIYGARGVGLSPYAARTAVVVEAANGAGEVDDTSVDQNLRTFGANVEGSLRGLEKQGSESREQELHSEVVADLVTSDLLE